MAVFCGSQSGNETLFATHTTAIGEILASKNVNIVYGGADRGLMAVVANAALHANGIVIGVLPQLLREIELQHKGLTELHVVDTMHTRKQLLFNKCDAAIILPGGFGTLDELFEMLTWNQLKIHEKKIFILNSNGFYDHLIAHIHKMHEAKFLYFHPDEIITIIKEPHELAQFL
jgi:uncharacterized protein (TIGR00730 family)